MLERIKENWNLIKEAIKEEHELLDVTYNAWIAPLEIVSLEGDTLTLLYPFAENGYRILSYIDKKYRFYLEVKTAEIIGKHFDIKFVLPNDLKKESSQKISASASFNIEETASFSAISNLNPKYTFDTFVVGANNQFAHAASLAVAESPAERYNPLFIYGGVGLGKTHLMHSIAHFILRNNPNTKVLYVTSEKFTNELIDAIRNKNANATAEFREKYRNIDVLLIDDIQFIVGKESTQEEFFHTFNSLHEAKKQIVISSDKPPKAFETLEERLRSRFEMGLSVDISAPDYETRMAILRKKEEIEGYNIDNEVLKYIASNIKSNIREIEGALTKITAFAKLNNTSITLDLAEAALKDMISPNEVHEVTPSYIISVVAEHFNLSAGDIISQKRNKEIVYPRQITMYLCREMTGSPLQLIGKELGGRDHSTILHGCEKISDEMKVNESTRNLIFMLKKKINPM